MSRRRSRERSRDERFNDLKEQVAYAHEAGRASRNFAGFVDALKRAEKDFPLWPMVRGLKLDDDDLDIVIDRVGSSCGLFSIRS
jgi:hypothetical protein